MLTPDLRHKHTGLNGDGEKIKFSDLDGIPTTAPFVGVSTGNAGTQQITGVGFKPSVIEIIAYKTTSPVAKSEGVASSSLQYRFNWFESASNTFVGYGTGYPIYVFDGASTSYASVASFDADGFTLNWVSYVIGVNFLYKCYR